MSRRYPPVYDGEWIHPPATPQTHKVQCCDCGLVHVFNFRIVKGRVQFQAFRNNRSTALVRRARGITIKHKD